MMCVNFPIHSLEGNISTAGRGTESLLASLNCQYIQPDIFCLYISELVFVLHITIANEIILC